MSHKPLISVVIPTLNEEKYLPITLGFLRAQRGLEWGKDFEVIVADGNSSDHTREIAHFMHAKVLTERTHTIAAGRQKGWRAARGEIIVFTDGDAQPPVDWLSNITRPLLEDSSISACYGPLYPSDGSFVEDVFMKTVFNLYLWATSLVGLPSGGGNNLAIRRSVLERSGGFDVNLVTAEDLEVQRKAKRYGKVPFILGAPTKVSARRVHQWGYVKYIAFHINNLLSLHFGDSRHARENPYEPIR
ncbi:Glycosyltransferase AglE [uncultured archaeon]|nr:Glycosyltransferase AglE [uncultured archaeon]